MDIQPQTTKPISDDQELAKVLAGVSKETNNDLDEVPPPTPDPVVASTHEKTSKSAATKNDDLTSIKKDALTELRPLVDKLDQAPEEKFDTYLLLLRSTDDTTLIAPAYAAARSITDEVRRAQALLDVIKEIDYLSSPPQSVN